MPLPAQNKKYSYKDYLTWGKEEKWELIDGVLYAMSSAPSRIYQEISMRLTNEIYNYLKGKECRENKSDEDVFNVVQPDITVVCDEKKSDDKGVKGAPDLIIEIVSSSTSSLDYVKKLNLYGDYGVREYWIINPKTKNLFVYQTGNQETTRNLKYIRSLIRLR